MNLFQFDKIFRDRTIENLKKDPLSHFKLVVRKAISYFLIDFNSPDKNYYHPLHYIPILLLGLTSLSGIFLSNKKSYAMNFSISNNEKTLNDKEIHEIMNKIQKNIETKFNGILRDK